MERIILILSIIFILIIGLVKILYEKRRIIKKHNFVFDFRNNFIDFTNNYFKGYDTFTKKSESFDNELYVWLTKNVNKVQSILGNSGIMDYVAPFQIYRIPRYEIIINTLPQFRNGSITEFDINSTDDCLLRYLGQLEKRIEKVDKELTNPVIWFTIGIQTVISIPLYFLNWFGLFSNRSIAIIKEGLFYKIISGIIALVGFLSGIVTIIVGKEQVIQFVKDFFSK